MSLKSKICRQTCVYWAPGNTESGGKAVDKYGKTVFTSPVEKDCRWEDTAEIFIGTNGVQETSKSVVMVDGVVTGGFLMLGTLTDVTDSTNPRNNTGAWVIKQVESIPNFKATVFYDWAYL